MEPAFGEKGFLKDFFGKILYIIKDHPVPAAISFLATVVGLPLTIYATFFTSTKTDVEAVVIPDGDKTRAELGELSKKIERFTAPQDGAKQDASEVTPPGPGRTPSNNTAPPERRAAASLATIGQATRGRKSQEEPASNTETPDTAPSAQSESATDQRTHIGEVVKAAPCATTREEAPPILFYVSSSISGVAVNGGDISDVVKDSIVKRIQSTKVQQTDSEECAKLNIFTNVNFHTNRSMGQIQYIVNINTSYVYDEKKTTIESEKKFSLPEKDILTAPVFWERCALFISLSDNFYKAKLDGVYSSAFWDRVKELGSEGNLASQCEAG